MSVGAAVRGQVYPLTCPTRDRLRASKWAAKGTVEVLRPTSYAICVDHDEKLRPRLHQTLLSVNCRAMRRVALFRRPVIGLLLLLGLPKMGMASMRRRGHMNMRYEGRSMNELMWLVKAGHV